MGERTMKLHTLSCQDLCWKISAGNNDLPHLGEIVTAADIRELIKTFLDYDKEVRFTKDSANIKLRWASIQLLTPIIKKVDDNIAEFLWSILREMERRYAPQIYWVVELSIYVKSDELFGGK